MTKRKSPAGKPKARRATKPKPAPAVIMKSVEGIDADTIREEPKLTLKQERFAQAYVENGGNATDAYRSAYDTDDMKPETVNNEAHKLLKHREIATRLDQLRADALRRHQITVDRILAEYSKLAFANMKSYMRVNADGLAEVDLSKLDDDQAAAIQELKVDRLRTIGTEDSEKQAYVERVTFKLADKRSALDSLSKCLGMFIDKHEVTGKDGERLIPETASARDLARSIFDILREAKLEGQGADDETTESGGKQRTSPDVAGLAANLHAAPLTRTSSASMQMPVA